MLRFFPLGILCLSAPAVGAEVPDIAIVGIHQDIVDLESQQDAVARIVAAIDEGGRFDALGRDEMAARIAGREPIILEDAFLGPGRRLLDDGRILYEQAQPEDAIATLTEAVDTLRVGMATANSSRDLWDAWMYLGTAHLAMGEPDKANEAWEAAIALTPARNPNPNRFPPDVVEAFDKLRQEQVSLASTLNIAADASQVTIYVNGESRGAAPVVLQNVLPGENHVIGRGADGSVAYVAVDVDPSSEESVALKMSAPTLGSAAESRFARARQATSLYRAVGQRSEVDLVLLAGIVEEQVQLQLYSATADGFSQPLSLSFTGRADDEMLASIDAVLEMVGQDGSLPVDQTVPNAIPIDVGDNRLLAQMLLNPQKPQVVLAGPVEPVPTPKKGRWVALGVGGTAAAAAAVGGVVYLTGQEPDPSELQQGTIIVGPVD